MEMCKEGIDNLREAILKRAIKDYASQFKHMYKTYLSKGASIPGRKETKSYIEYEYYRSRDFFFGSWFDLLCNINGSYIIESVEKEVVKEVKGA